MAYFALISAAMSQIKNVLVLGGDHFRHDAMSWTGTPLAQTPNLDRLCVESAVFTHCFNQSPVCQPARHCLASGCYAHRNGVTMNGQRPYSDYRTIGHVLADYDMRRVNIGHMHWHRSDVPGQLPHHGFESWTKRELLMKSLPWFQRWEAEDAAGIRTQTGGPGPRDRTQQTGYIDMQQAIASMRESAASGQPFLIWCAFSEPHPPFTPPRSYYERIPLDAIVLPPEPRESVGLHPAILARQKEWAHLTDYEVRQIIRAYYGLVAMLDDYVGQILDELDRLGLRESTAIIWFSDHGDQLWEHRMFLKFVMREASIRVPLMISGPGIEPGRHDALVEHVDLAPTICDLLGITPATWMQGRSLQPFLNGNGVPECWRDAVFSEIDHQHYSIRMIRTKHHKLNRYGDGLEELFDLDADPLEFTNVSTDPAAQGICDELRSRLECWYQDTAPPTPNMERVAWA